MKQVTQAAVPMELSCVSYKAATFTLLAVLLLFLPFVVSGLLKCYKKKLRQSKRSRSQRMVAIGRRKNNKVGKVSLVKNPEISTCCSDFAQNG